MNTHTNNIKKRHKEEIKVQFLKNDFNSKLINNSSWTKCTPQWKKYYEQDYVEGEKKIGNSHWAQWHEI